ncbi:hypothetical protein GPECTOR_742g904 [Gonium pectorale]|uniref:Uncharacterized protein n=1 Tax=Gonium pectorale TaxID=33097 RepID=A0A150FU66_GONPE|nr:hypothetical protein GPECTOR_742g904 [Gonium pectorale]|eukprot:KXZ41136.1 hypothetical protein GPECTOR_742g904 [Gonium pectorale]
MCISSLVNVEKFYGDQVAELQREKEQGQFAARHRDYVSKFDDRAFVYLVRHEPKYQRALAAGAQQVTNKSDLFKVLKAIKSAEEDGDEDAAAVHFTPHNLQLREAWYEAIKAKGLSLEEYQALRIFKDSTNRTFHQSPTAREALQLLNTSLPVPSVYAAYKEPLVKLLQVLVQP